MTALNDKALTLYNRVICGFAQSYEVMLHPGDALKSREQVRSRRGS
jgi:hypothetical protein